MSFSFTTPQIRDGTKTVTRRLGWRFLSPGDLVMACVKTMGLRKGEKVERIRPIRITSVRRERLDAIDQEDVIREGYPGMTPPEFVAMFCEGMDCEPAAIVTRIEFEYAEEESQ